MLLDDCTAGVFKLGADGAEGEAEVALWLYEDIVPSPLLL
jgi:hypothetical protein